MKKEKLLSIIVLSTTSCCLQASPIEVSLNDWHDTKPSTGHPCARPSVSYDDDEITIKSDSTIHDVTVVVKDQYGQVLVNSTVTVSQGGTIIYVPENDDSEKTTIDLYYKREHAKGYF